MPWPSIILATGIIAFLVTIATMIFPMMRIRKKSRMERQAVTEAKIKCAGITADNLPPISSLRDDSVETIHCLILHEKAARAGLQKHA